MVEDSSRLFDKLLVEAVREEALLIPGTKLGRGRFVVRALLGTGGMGAVYRATDTRRNRDVAVKVLSRVDAAGIYGLKKEFRSLSDVDHPNLVTLHELHSDGETWFFSMDLVEGEPLSEVKWTLHLVRSVFGQLAEAIQAIHQRGKLHRDLKPSNVMIASDGRAVVLDFGLVSDQVPGGTGWTQADDGLAGTPTYMAPEQASAEVTPESDWYAYGTMLYEALFGRPPFEETGVAALVRKREEPASPPPERVGDVPEDLERFCLRLLERDAAKRPSYPEITEFLGTADIVGTPADDHQADPFVGRKGELHALEEALRVTDAGRNAVVSVSGGPGIGKTRLVERFLEVTRKELGGVALSGRCPKWEHVPFRACDSLVDNLSRYLRLLPTARAATLLPRNTLALARLFPVLDRLPAMRTIKQRRNLPRDPSELKGIGLLALKELLGNIAAQDRLVVFVDDMQWSDHDGARFLASLITPDVDPEAPALLLVIAHRTQYTEAAPGLGTFLQRVASNPLVHFDKLRLRELNEKESRSLAVLLLNGQLGIEKRIALEARGNPLFIRQLVRHALDSDINGGRLDFDGVLAQRIASLATQERETLSVVCLTPRPVPLGVLSKVTEQPDPVPTLRNLESARLARFVPGPGDSVTVFHERIREFVLSGMGGHERLLLHTRFVEALEQRRDPDLVALTPHYFGCGRESDGAACAVLAAGQATSVLAFEQAAAMYRLALDYGQWAERERTDLLVRLAEALVLDRRSGEAGTQFLEAASLETDRAERLALRLRAADQYLAGGWLEVGIDLLRDIFTEVGLHFDKICDSSIIELRTELAQRGLNIKPRPESEIEPETLDRLKALSVAGSGLAWIKLQSVQLRLMLALEAFDAGEPMRFACGLKTAARVDAQLDPKNVEVYNTVQQICDDNPGIQADMLRPNLEMGMAFVRGCPWSQYDAARRTEELLLQHPTQDARVLSVARYHQALALHLLGEEHELRRRCRRWLEDAKERHDLFLEVWLNTLLAGERLAGDQPETARQMCRRSIRMWAAAEDSGLSVLNFCSTMVLCSCDAYIGDEAAGDRILETARRSDHMSLQLMPFLDCYRHGTWAAAALARAEQVREQPWREELMAWAEASIEIVARPRVPGGRAIILPHYRNLATLLSAGLAALRGDADSALAALNLGLEQLSDSGYYTLRSAHARRAKGRLLGGTEGDELVSEAEGELRSLGVENPARHARVVLPGFADLGEHQEATL